MSDITATYSPEDNKLRLYSFHRLDDETYQQVKAAGFRWAPRQDLFVAPSWSPAREDLCLELAGEIDPEGTSLAERAASKAERLDNLSSKRMAESNAFSAAAGAVSARFAGGQPILIGHHSERKARRDHDKANNMMSNARKAHEASGYWLYRANGVERHANMKADAGVRFRRIKKLLKELRDCQRSLNHAHICLDIWDKLNAMGEGSEQVAAVEHFTGAHIATGAVSPWGLWSGLTDGSITAQKAIDMSISSHTNVVESDHISRWITHLLNRLGYERSELGAVTMFDGKITAPMLQTFARTQGAHKPKARATEAGWTITSSAPLPAHLADGQTLELPDDLWRTLMAGVGYEVPGKADAKPPLLNFEAATITAARFGGDHVYSQRTMTKEEYSAVRKDSRGVFTSACGTFRFKVTFSVSSGSAAVFLSDSKIHPAPDSTSIAEVA